VVRSSAAQKNAEDLKLWRPVGLEERELGSFAFLVIEEVAGAEVVATVFRWPRIDDRGRLELQRHCALRAPQTGTLAHAFTNPPPLVNRRSSFPFLVSASSPPLKTGEVAAVMTADEDFWDEGEDLADWGRFSLPLLKITDEANGISEARFVPVAWTLWRDWLAKASLIAHVGRLAAEEVGRASGGPALVSFESRIDEDSEKFFSPEDYLEKSTPEALQQPDSVVVRAGDERLWVRLSIARRRDQRRTWLKNAVLLEASSISPTELERVTGLHDRIAAAVRRGGPGWGAEGSRTSVAGFRPLDEEGKPQEIPEPWRAKAQRRSSRILLASVGFLGALLGALSELGEVGLLIAGALVGLFVGGVLVFWPGVEFTARRSARISRLAAKGVGAPLIGAGEATVLRAITEGKL
jgi:hypothetical protein